MIYLPQSNVAPPGAEFDNAWVCQFCGGPPLVGENGVFMCPNCGYRTIARDIYFRKRESKATAWVMKGRIFREEGPKTVHYQLVEAFAQKIGELGGIKLHETPTLGTVEERKHRARLIYEECMETIWKGLGLKVAIDGREIDMEAEPHFVDYHDGDLVELIDGVCDSKVVLTGTLVHFGIPDNYFQHLVDWNNLQKFEGEYGFDRGKLVKPKDHPKPPIAEALKELEADAFRYGHGNQ